jgi:hypothetical protein
MNTTPTPIEDMQARLRPSASAVAYAVAALAEAPGAEYAMIPMVLPGKHYGIWYIGQEVRTVEGVTFTCTEGKPSGDTPGYREARDMAIKAGLEALGDRPGTVATATVVRDGSAAIFEEPPAGGINSQPEINPDMPRATYHDWAHFNEGAVEPADYGLRLVRFYLNGYRGTLVHEFTQGQPPRMYLDGFPDDEPGEVIEMGEPVLSVETEL